MLQTKAYAPALYVYGGTVKQLGAVYKQLNAPFGMFAMNLLSASTRALRVDDATYVALEGSIANLTGQRDALAAQIRTATRENTLL